MKTALITGASGSIGSAICELFVQNGYFVIATYNADKKGIENLVDKLRAQSLSDYIFPVSCDFSDTKNIDAMLENLSKSFKHIDVLVNNAGLDYYGLLTDTTDDVWQKVFAVNSTAPYKLSKWALKGMIERKSGKIVNVSSVWGNVGASMEVCYSASKSALIGFTKALAKEVALSNITVNCVCPGVIDTKMNARFNADEMQELKNEIPLGRLGESSEIAELIYFLASDKANYITGQIVTADGGFTV